MAWVTAIDRNDSDGRLQPSQVVAKVKVFRTHDGSPIVQIDTLGSADREIPGKTSQTLQFGREAAKQLFDVLRDTYGFDGASQ